MSLHPDKAARVTRIAQAGVIAAAALAVAAWIIHLPEPETPEADATPVSSPRPAPKKPATPTAVHTDWTELAPVLVWATPPGASTPDTPGTVASKPGGVETPLIAPPPAGPTLPSWRYLGFVRRADTLIGLVSVDGRQKFVTPGQEVSGYTIASIDMDHLQVTKGAESHRLDLIAPPGTDGRAPAFRQTTPRPVRPNRTPTPAPAPRMDQNSAAERDRALEREREKAKEHAGERPQR